MSVQVQQPVDGQRDVDSQQSTEDELILESRQSAVDQQLVDDQESAESQHSADQNDLEVEQSPDDEMIRVLRTMASGEWLRGGPAFQEPIRLPGVSTQAVSICPEALALFREAARDYGYLNHFFRQADEAFTDAVSMTDSYGTSRVPFPLLIPLGGDDYIAFYAIVIRTHQISNPCWLSYHEGFKTIMRRVARELDVPTELPIMYMRLQSVNE
ncbi:hypothetical protein E4T39_08350 [Aureobasidium subglaciale]|nr:hypothetical protein E4T39_08350 [Aureobasidium subglaciale]